MNKKRFVISSILSIGLLLFVPFTITYADHEQGWLYGDTSQGYEALFDGDHSTYYEIAKGNSIIVDFPTSLETTQFFINYNASGGGVRLDFYNDLDESLKMSFLPSTRNDFSTLEIVNVSKVKITANNANALLYEFDIYGSEYTGPDLTAPNEVSNLDVIATDSEITLTYNFPNDEDFSHVKIYQDNVLLADDVTTTTYSVGGLSFGVTYDFKVTTVDTSGNESLGTSHAASLLEPTVGEIGNLKSEVNNNVKLFWKNPESTYFDHVNIYRKQIEDKSFLEGLFSARILSAAEISDEYTLMYETNGTTWTDLDITPGSIYEYLVTTVSVGEIESEGVILSVTIPEEPLPVMEDETIVETGEDYVVTWSSPLTGQIKVLIGGDEYAVVEASLGTITIPKEDMEYTFFGEPDIELIPISESGLEGNPTEPEGRDELGSLNLGFNVNDVLITGMKILAWVAPLLLLTLAIRFQKPIIELLRKAASYIKGTRKRG